LIIVSISRAHHNHKQLTFINIDKKVHFRHILLFFYRKRLKAVEAQREICGVYRNSAISANSCQSWFARFRSRDINFADAARSDHPSTTDDQILAAIKVDRYLTTRESASTLLIQQFRSD